MEGVGNQSERPSIRMMASSGMRASRLDQARVVRQKRLCKVPERESGLRSGLGVGGWWLVVGED